MRFAFVVILSLAITSYVTADEPNVLESRIRRVVPPRCGAITLRRLWLVAVLGTAPALASIGTSASVGLVAQLTTQ